MALKLDILKDVKNRDSYRNYSYADLHLDIELNSFLSNKTVGANKNNQDLKLSYDESAIYNSIRNTFNTKKGQKILDPNFGLDIIARPEQNEYKISISITIPSLNNKKGTANGLLTATGFTYT